VIEIEWGAVVGIGGLLLAGFTTWLSYRERSKWYRERLYDRQLDGCLALYGSASDVYSAVLGGMLVVVLAELEKEPPPDDAWKAATKTRGAMLKLRRRWDVLLPDSVTALATGFYDAATRVVGHPSSLGPGAAKPDVSEESRDAMVEAFQGLVRSIRDSIGVDPLSRANLKLIGSPDPIPVEPGPPDNA
jgi:hypothetical protein